MSYNKRIKYLEKKYSETHLAKDEKLFPDTIRQMRKTYNKNQQKRRVDTILNNVKNKDSIKAEVHDIIGNVELKSLCRNCKEEQIIAVIILYVQRSRNTSYRIERTALWREHELDWLKYSLIMERLLKWTREQKKLELREVERFDDVW